MNPKRICRLYKEMGLQLRNKTPKRRVKAKLGEDHVIAACSNETWVMDFVHDQLVTGSKLRILTIIDTFSRYLPETDPRFATRAETPFKRRNVCVERLGATSPFVWIMGANLSPVTLIYGFIRKASFRTSHGLANQLTTPSSGASTASSVPNTQMLTGS